MPHKQTHTHTSILTHANTLAHTHTCARSLSLSLSLPQGEFAQAVHDIRHVITMIESFAKSELPQDQAHRIHDIAQGLREGTVLDAPATVCRLLLPPSFPRPSLLSKERQSHS